MVRANLPIVRIVSPDVRTLTSSGPPRPLLGRVIPPIERVLFTEPAWNLTTSRPDTRSLSHLDSPFHARRPKPSGRKVQQRVALTPQQSYPGAFGLTELIKFVGPVQLIHHHVVAILLTQPVVEGCLSTRRSLLPMLTKPHLRRFCRKTDIAIRRLRPKPDPIDQAPGRKFGRHQIPRQRQAITTCN